jgi:hypothetical protein
MKAYKKASNRKLNAGLSLSPIKQVNNPIKADNKTGLFLVPLKSKFKK